MKRSFESYLFAQESGPRHASGVQEPFSLHEGTVRRTQFASNGARGSGSSATVSNNASRNFILPLWGRWLSLVAETLPWPVADAAPPKEPHFVALKFFSCTLR
eukprot:5563734-Pyramimonas_sp.AAC.1